MNHGIATRTFPGVGGPVCHRFVYRKSEFQFLAHSGIWLEGVLSLTLTQGPLNIIHSGFFYLVSS